MEDLEVRSCTAPVARAHANLIGRDPHQLWTSTIIRGFTVFNEEGGDFVAQLAEVVALGVGRRLNCASQFAGVGEALLVDNLRVHHHCRCECRRGANVLK